MRLMAALAVRRNHWNSTLKRKVQQGQIRPPTPQQAAELTAKMLRALPVKAIPRLDTLLAAPEAARQCAEAGPAPTEEGANPITWALPSMHQSHQSNCVCFACVPHVPCGHHPPRASARHMQHLQSICTRSFC